ncbi:hypothetical protein JQ581_29960 [Bradyrhizobium liaoningense]|uniref:hypothetical protein n=1 Tax=Bradyrhizobium liaoningense TaxID=43992 RepID=UPI001BA4A8F4|nr:hypothetical protein [Bradyrhizobium liaoningense]MBR0741165.1 hypothetical protein [Bradyrhizobium liaoningense]
MAPRVAYRQPQAGGQGFARTKKVFGGPVLTLTAADVALNAQTAIMRVPKGFVLMSWSGTVGDIDSGATLMLAIGDAGNNARFMAASNIGQAGAALPALAAGGVLYEFTDDTDILLTATVAAAGLAATPTINVLMEGYMK